jgi:hypothetical protein
MLQKRGYNLIMWVVVLAVISAALVFVQVPLKRALQYKARASADYFFWRQWGQEPRSFWRDETSRLTERVNQSKSETVLTSKSGESRYIIGDNTTSDQSSLGTEKGAEERLQSQALP